MARGMLCVCLLLIFCSGFSVSNPYYMDHFCDQSIYLKDHHAGLDLHFTESEFYSGDLNCSVRLVARTHHRITVTFMYLDVLSFVSCPEDYLAIGECLPERPCEGVCCVLSSLHCCQLHHRKIMKFCGVTVPSTSYSSLSNIISLKFISDARFFGRGFHLYVTTFHEGACVKDEVRCSNGRCIPYAIQCSKGDNCGDGSDPCNIITPAVIAGFAVGGVIVVFTFSIAIVILWYYRKHGMGSNRYIQRRERYIRRRSTPVFPPGMGYTNEIVITTPPHIPTCVPVMS